MKKRLDSQPFEFVIQFTMVHNNLYSHKWLHPVQIDNRAKMKKSLDEMFKGNVTYRSDLVQYPDKKVLNIEYSMGAEYCRFFLLIMPSIQQ